MAELTNLESKLGEVLGLAMAAQVATRKVERLARKQDTDLAAVLRRMTEEAAETERRCLDLTTGFKGKKTAIHQEALKTKKKGAEMLATYLDADADALDGLEFLTMAEAAEVGHWSVLQEMGGNARNSQVTRLVRWALPIQERHFTAVLEASKRLAREEDPNETA
jgi:hypothetical protein